MSDTDRRYTKDEIISILENRDLEKFDICDNYAYIYTDSYEIMIEAPNEIISEENILFTTKVLRSLDECLAKADRWLAIFDFSSDRWHPHALDAGFEMYRLYIGSYSSSGVPIPWDDGFIMTFDAVNNCPCGFAVKFHKNMVPFAAEEFVN